MYHALRILAIVTGLGILAVAVYKNTGGDPFALGNIHCIALAAGTAVAALVIGYGTDGRMAFALISALIAGEVFMLVGSAETVIVTRDDRALQARKANQPYQIADAALDDAKTARKKAEEAVIEETKRGGCKTICKELEAKADTARQREREARETLSTMPPVRSEAVLADRIGWAPWAVDLIQAALASIGINGLAGCLIGFGPRRPKVNVEPAASSERLPDPKKTDAHGRSDFLAVTEVDLDTLSPSKAVISFAARFKEKHGRFPEYQEAKNALPGINRGTVHKYLKAAIS